MKTRRRGRPRESHAACLVVSATIHSGWGHFLYDPSHPCAAADLVWSASSGEGCIRGKRRVTKTLENTGLSLYVRHCESWCVGKQQLSTHRFFRRNGEKERSFPGMKFLALLKLRVQLEHFSHSPTLFPPSPPLPSLFRLGHFLPSLSLILAVFLYFLFNFSLIFTTMTQVCWFACFFECK